MPAAVAAEAGCPYRLRLLHWNLQQTKAADAAKLRAVLRYARAHSYDAVSLNELSNTEEELRAIGAPHGYAHARLLQGAHATRLGVLSSHPLVDARPPLTAGIGHGLLCVRPAAAAGADGAAWPDLCVTHLTAYGEARRQPEVSALLHALPQSSAEPTVLLGDLNVLSPLDGFVALAGNGGGGAAGGVAAAAAAHAAAALPVLRGTKKLEKKFLDGRGGAAVGSMGRLLAASYVDVPVASGGGTPTLRLRSTVGAPVQQALDLRLDYALANAALHRRCAAGTQAMWARVLPPASLRLSDAESSADAAAAAAAAAAPTPAEAAAAAAAAATAAAAAAVDLSRFSEHLPLELVFGAAPPAELAPLTAAATDALHRAAAATARRRRRRRRRRNWRRRRRDRRRRARRAAAEAAAAAPSAQTCGWVAARYQWTRRRRRRCPAAWGLARRRMRAAAAAAAGGRAWRWVRVQRGAASRRCATRSGLPGTSKNARRSLACSRCSG